MSQRLQDVYYFRLFQYYFGFVWWFLVGQAITTGWKRQDGKYGHQIPHTSQEKLSLNILYADQDSIKKYMYDKW